MTTVQISITSDDGDLTVTEEDRRVTTYGGPDERERISRLLRQAFEKVDRAYGLGNKRGTEVPKSTGAGE